MVVFFEYFITFGQEVDLFWRGKITGATVLFLANRYLSMILFGYMVVINSFPLFAYNAQVSGNMTRIEASTHRCCIGVRSFSLAPRDSLSWS